MTTKTLRLHGDHLTLGQALKVAGAVDTGGQAKHLVRKGGVRVNGTVETRPGHKLRAGDRFQINDREWLLES